MSQVCAFLLVLIASRLVLGYPGETLMVMPPFEVRTLDTYPHAKQFQGNRKPGERQPILHTNMDQNHKISPQQRVAENNNYIAARNEVKNAQHKEKESHIKPASFLLGRDSNESAYRPYPGSYGGYGGSYTPPSATSYGSSSSYKAPTLPAPAAPSLPALSILKPDLSTIFKPAATKVSGKVSGLLGLILSLLSGSSSGFQLNGLKDVLVSGIIQPLLAAKIGIKSLIAKLAIPVVALILINLEVLVTVWWLWEDCPVEKPSEPAYSYQQPAYNNNYNSHS